MKHFYRTTDQNSQTELLMTALMGKQELFEGTGIEGLWQIKVPNPKLPQFTGLTLGVMAMCNTLELSNSVIVKCAPGLTAPMGPGGGPPFPKTFAMVFHAGEGVLLNAGDEAVYIHSREVWDISATDTLNLINKSEDDVFILFVTVRMD